CSRCTVNANSPTGLCCHKASAKCQKLAAISLLHHTIDAERHKDDYTCHFAQPITRTILDTYAALKQPRPAHRSEPAAYRCQRHLAPRLESRPHRPQWLRQKFADGIA